MIKALTALGIIGATIYIIIFCFCLFSERHFIFPFRFLNSLKDYYEWRNSSYDFSILKREGGISHIMPKNLPILEFDKFLDLYSINPKKYDIDGTYAVKYNESSKYYNCYQAVFTFSYPDWLRYDAWKKNNKQQKAAFESDKRSAVAQVAMYDMLKDAEQDIEKLKAKSQQEMEAAAKKAAEIGQRVAVNNEEFVDFLQTLGACGDAMLSGDTSSSEAPQPSPPLPDMTLIANWPDYIEWEDRAGRRWYQQRKKGR